MSKAGDPAWAPEESTANNPGVGAAMDSTKDSVRALAKLCGTVDGEVRIVGTPPLVTPIEDVLPGAEQAHLEDTIRRMIRTYRRSLPRDRQALLERYRYVHAG